MAFITAMHMIVRDKCDPQVVHHALLELEEYEDGCADDMPGIDNRWRPVKPLPAAESCEQFCPDGVRSHTARTSHTSLD